MNPPIKNHIRYHYVVHWQTHDKRYQQNRFDTLADADTFRAFIEVFYRVFRTETVDLIEEEASRRKMVDAAPRMYAALKLIRDRFTKHKAHSKTLRLIYAIADNALKLADEGT